MWSHESCMNSYVINLMHIVCSIQCNGLYVYLL